MYLTGDRDAGADASYGSSEIHRSFTLTSAAPCSPPSPPTTAASWKIYASDRDTQPLVASQNSANSGGSKRIVSKGEEIVRDSDSDDDSILSLDWGEPKKTPDEARSVTRTKRTSNEEEDGLRRPQKQSKSGKNSLATVVETAQRNIRLEERIKEHKADLEKPAEEPSCSEITLNVETLGQVVEEVDEEPEKAHRLLQAIQRTRATHTDSCFYFFDRSTCRSHERSPFPVDTLPKHRWVANFEGVPHRIFYGAVLTTFRTNR